MSDGMGRGPPEVHWHVAVAEANAPAVVAIANDLPAGAGAGPAVLAPHYAQPHGGANDANQEEDGPINVDNDAANQEEDGLVGADVDPEDRMTLIELGVIANRLREGPWNGLSAQILYSLVVHMQVRHTCVVVVRGGRRCSQPGSGPCLFSSPRCAHA